MSKSKPGKRVSKKSARSKRSQSAPRVDRSKRLLDLVMLLLRARVPVTFTEIRSQFDSYQTANIEAGLRAFERDKADLLELGVPIRYVTPDEDGALEEGGYVVELKKYRLPEVHLTPDEISALVLATSVARAVPSVGYARICDLAVRKLAFDYPEPDTPLALPQAQETSRESVLVHFPEATSERDLLLGDRFSNLEAATRNRKRVTLDYRSASSASSGELQTRELDPYGLFYRERSWLVVGHCHLRNDTRSFRLDRIENLKVAPKPRSPDFERPVDFDVRKYAGRSPWTFAPCPVEEVTLAITGAALSVANEDFGSAQKSEQDDGSIVLHFESGNPDYIVSRILSAKGGLRLVAGAQCKARLAEELSAIEELYA